MSVWHNLIPDPQQQIWNKLQSDVAWLAATEPRGAGTTPSGSRYFIANRTIGNVQGLGRDGSFYGTTGRGIADSVHRQYNWRDGWIMIPYSGNDMATVFKIAVAIFAAYLVGTGMTALLGPGAGTAAGSLATAQVKNLATQSLVGTTPSMQQQQLTNQSGLISFGQTSPTVGPGGPNPGGPGGPMDTGGSGGGGGGPFAPGQGLDPKMLLGLAAGALLLILILRR